MQDVLILKPMFAQAGLTLGVFVWLMLARNFAIMSGRIKMEDFGIGISQNESPALLKARAHHANLLEWPVLFYAVCILYAVTGKTDDTVRFWAWLYVGFRTAHALVHLTFNAVIVRFSAFFASQIVLALMWWNLAKTLF